VQIIIYCFCPSVGHAHNEIIEVRQQIEDTEGVKITTVALFSYIVWPNFAQ